MAGSCDQRWSGLAKISRPPISALRAAACDVFVTVGTSSVVYPAAGFPLLAKRNGAGLVIINRDATEQDELADLVINAEIGSTLSRTVGVN